MTTNKHEERVIGALNVTRDLLEELPRQIEQKDLETYLGWTVTNLALLVQETVRAFKECDEDDVIDADEVKEAARVLTEKGYKHGMKGVMNASQNKTIE